MLSSNTSATNGAANYIEDVFSTYLYTGNGTSQEITNNINLDARFLSSNIASVRNTESYSTIYAQGKYITCSGNKILTSTDGATWVVSSSSPSGGYGNIAFDGTSQFMFLSGASGYCYTSTDLVSWTSVGTRGVVPSAFSAIGTTYVEFGVLPGTSTQAGYYSSNSGASWTSFSNIFTSYGENPGILKLVNGILFGCRSNGIYVKLASSTNGTTWTDRSSGISGAYAIYDITYGNGKYVAIDYAGNYYYSTDLSSWTLVAGSGGTAGNIGFVNGYFVSAGVASTYAYRIKTSTDGATWTTIGGMASVQSDSSNGMTCADGSAGVMFVTQAARNSLCVDPTQATKGGLVWSKIRSAAGWHALADTARGTTKILYTNSTSAQSTLTESVTSFTSTGFDVGSTYEVNNSGSAHVSWTFRKQPKFFDVVTYTGNGSTQVINHTLGSTPGCVIVKKVSGVSGVGWVTYHRSTGVNKYLLLNATDAAANATAIFSDMTSTTFGVGNYSDINESGATYVAYLYAHDAGGFGLTGTDNVISCGTFTPNGSGVADVNLGYEAQWVLYKPTSDATWQLMDSTRGMPDYSSKIDFTAPTTLFPNTSAAESGYDRFWSTSTGFKLANGYGSQPYIYIAVRKGPMKVPTDATKVFKPVTRTGTGATAAVTGLGFAPDTVMSGDRNGVSNRNSEVFDRLRGKLMLSTWLNNAEFPNTNGMVSFDSDGVTLGVDDGAYGINKSGSPYVNWFFKRAPSFFDVVCYTNDGTRTPRNHNLTVAPELVITKTRESSGSWYVTQYLSTTPTYRLLQTADAFISAGSNYPVTATTFVSLAESSSTEVTYLFATCAGVSKVGSYTGTGTTKQVDCGFAAGARFVLIKRTDSTGDWYVWDTARGIVSGNDAYLLFNSSAAEVTSTDYIDTYAAGFEISSTAPAAINASGGSYIFLAIA